MSTIIEKSETTRTIDGEGNVTESTVETTKKVSRNTEPDFIKLYTSMWCEYNQIAQAARPLFLELVTHMTYANTNSPDGGQIVVLSGLLKETILQDLGIKESALYKELRQLIDCGAIRKLERYRGTYQVNPQYAGRGEWKYNPKADRGGVEDLIATFRFKEKSVETDIVWADDGENSDLNATYREGLDVKPKDNTVIKEKKLKPLAPVTGQLVS